MFILARPFCEVSGYLFVVFWWLESTHRNKWIVAFGAAHRVFQPWWWWFRNHYFCSSFCVTFTCSTQSTSSLSEVALQQQCIMIYISIIIRISRPKCIGTLFKANRKTTRMEFSYFTVVLFFYNSVKKLNLIITGDHCVSSSQLTQCHHPSLVSVWRFSAVQKHTVEFNQLAMANSEGSEAMLNRVMTKDNIGVAVLLEVRKEMMELSCEYTALLWPLNLSHWVPYLTSYTSLTDSYHAEYTFVLS